MNISEHTTIKELQALKRRIEKKITSKQSGDEDTIKYYGLIKNDHARHRREDGRKLFRGVVDYLECYVNGLPPIAKASFYERFGIQGKRTKITPEIIGNVKVLLGKGLTLQAISDQVGVSPATCQKIKKGIYDS